MVTMNPISSTIEKVLNKPQKKYTKEEAQDVLRKYGILDSDNSVTGEFRQIFVKKAEQSKKNYKRKAEQIDE